MEEKQIVDLFWERNTAAIRETAAKYDGYCKMIARNILGNDEDAEECVNDAYLRVWNSIPPNRPAVFSAYLGKITRGLAFDRYRRAHAEKRGGGEIPLVLEELEACLSSPNSVEREYDKKELICEINAFLNTLPQVQCRIFLCRYWYALPVSEIAVRFNMSENRVSVTLHRLRAKLKKHLTERGFSI